MKHGYIEIIRQTSSILSISFCENQKLNMLKNILEYIDSSKELYYYFFFRHEEFNVDLEPYKELYEELSWDYGFFRLKESEIRDYQFITDLFNGYQIASFYINKISDLDKKCDNDSIFKSCSSFNGYIIVELDDDYIVLDKDSYLPSWDFEKMGIYIERNYQISNPMDTPASFETRWQNDDLRIEYSDIQTTKKGLQTGILSINGESFSEYRFGGPFLYSSSFLLVPVYIKIFLSPICKLARIDLSDYSIELFGKGHSTIYLQEADSYRAFFYTDLSKTQSDFIQMPRIGKMIVE